MSTSTNGIICYGCMINEDESLPWNNEHYNGDTDKWWRDVNEYKPPFELYDAKGEYLNGVKPSGKQEDEYFEHRWKWKEANPLPFAEVNFCSGDCPLYILAVPDTVKTARRGFPEEFDPHHLKVDEKAKKKLMEFLETYPITSDMKMSWYLCSYWG